MKTKYIQLRPESSLPDISALKPFRAIVIICEKVSAEWQAKVSSWLVQSGCMYMMAWGENCSSWDDSVDMANIESFDYKDIPDNNFVMTTWHDHETLEEVFWFSKNCAFHPTVELNNTLLLHLSDENQKEEMLAKLESA